jgi:uncharacterized surface protein with fasciclin (FAS1) repeats
MTVQFTPRLRTTAIAISTFFLIAGLASASHAATGRNKPVTTTTPAADVTPASTPAMDAAASTQATPAPRAAGNIIDVATNAGQFTTLVAAITAAGLVETLNGAGPFTVFAPSDAAFAKLPAGTVENLLMPENKTKLAALLSYHVVPGRVASADLAGVTTTPATVQGGTLNVDTREGVKIGGATVTTPDIAASNGVIHVIDTVLMPPAAQ